MRPMLELLPEWCAAADVVPAGLHLDIWHVVEPAKKPLSSMDGDDWRPGTRVVLTRDVEVDERELRRTLGLSAATAFGVGVRWYCQQANLAGVHDEGPLPLSGDGPVVVTLPPAIAGSVEFETMIVLTTATDSDPPLGSLIWSDSWSDRHAGGPRELVLEGDEFRVPVVIVDFASILSPVGRRALWHIDVDLEAQMDDLAANVVSVQLNKQLLQEQLDGESSRLPGTLMQTIRIDMLRHLCTRFLSEPEPDEPADDTVASLLQGIIAGIGETWPGAANLLGERPSEFDARLWSAFSSGEWA